MAELSLAACLRRLHTLHARQGPALLSRFNSRAHLCNDILCSRAILL